MRAIERQINEEHLATHEAEATHLEGYEQLSKDEKNKGKYFTTFPYPYMNGYLHLGKSIFKRLIKKLVADISLIIVSF